jgi:hypothetical protein
LRPARAFADDEVPSADGAAARPVPARGPAALHAGGADSARVAWWLANGLIAVLFAPAFLWSGWMSWREYRARRQGRSIVPPDDEDDEPLSPVQITGWPWR